MNFIYRERDIIPDDFQKGVSGIKFYDAYAKYTLGLCVGIMEKPGYIYGDPSLCNWNQYALGAISVDNIEALRYANVMQNDHSIQPLNLPNCMIYSIQNHSHKSLQYLAINSLSNTSDFWQNCMEYIIYNTTDIEMLEYVKKQGAIVGNPCECCMLADMKEYTCGKFSNNNLVI